MARAHRSVMVELALGDDDFCKRLKDPTQSDTFHLEAFLSFTEAVKLDRGNANLRPPSKRKPAYKAMIETVKNAPETFHVKNRGITYFCDRFQYDNGKKVLHVTLPQVIDEDDEPKFGIADGGHTYEVIRETVAKLSEYEAQDAWNLPYVRIHFIAGARNFAASEEDIVEALNTSSQVQQFTLEEYAGEFEELKEALSKAGFDISHIAFR